MPARQSVRAPVGHTIQHVLHETQKANTYPHILRRSLKVTRKNGLASRMLLRHLAARVRTVDEIDIKLLGKTEGSPFQVQIRKFGRRLKGAKRNFIDVGYGVSQALPLLTELLRKDAPSMFLLQQPEVHLHPSAQAALGSLFCNIAGPNGNSSSRPTATTFSIACAWTSATRRPISNRKTFRSSSSNQASLT